MDEWWRGQKHGEQPDTPGSPYCVRGEQLVDKKECVWVCVRAQVHLQGRGIRKKGRKVASTPTHSLSPNNILVSGI